MLISTLHTNDAPSTVNRLMNMGIEPFLVATSVNLICAQRLVRRICSNCKEELEVPPQVLLDAGYSEAEVKTTKNQASFTVLSLATKRSWKDRETGERQSQTTWHRIIAWRRLGEFRPGRSGRSYGGGPACPAREL